MTLLWSTFCCGVCASILAMKMRWEMSSSQAYTKPGALVGLRMWKVLLQMEGKVNPKKTSLTTNYAFKYSNWVMVDADEGLTRRQWVSGSWWSQGRVQEHWAPTAAWWKCGGMAAVGILSDGHRGPGSTPQRRYPAPKEKNRERDQNQEIRVYMGKNQVKIYITHAHVTV